MSPAEQESDSLSTLEDRIQRAVQLITSLRQERDAAIEVAEQARAETARLSAENQNLHTERRQVRARIEKLLGQIDQLSTS
jgi:FtsZ-binding cell division protein ZapB